MTTVTLRTIAKRNKPPRSGGLGRRLFMTFTLPVILVALWWFGSMGSTNYLNPPLATIIGQFVPTWFGGEEFAATRFARDVIPSVLRVLAGYGIALVAGIALGVLIGMLRGLRAYLEPVLEFFRAVPPPVLVPVFMLFMGIGPEMRIAVIAIGCIWPILLNTVEGVRALDSVQHDITKAYRIRLRRITHFVLPGASPQIVTGARQALPIGIILMVISEMFAGRDGLGFAIVSFQRSFAIPQMWSGVILLGLLGVVLSLVFRVVSGAVLKWYHGYLRTQRGGS